jgi:uncharacterized phage protein gp47/JayE
MTEKTFVVNVDYRMRSDSVEWLGAGEQPDNNTTFIVQYLFNKSSGISDINPGSVVRTLVEAISREIEMFYLQMEQAYLSGFLDTATGNALDLVISILGIKRKPPQPSSGCVTFGRNNEPELLSVNQEVHLYDGSLEYALSRSLSKEITKLKGTCKDAPTNFEKDLDFVLAGNKVRWLPEGKKPDAKTLFQADYVAYREIAIPKGTSISTFSLKPEETRLFATTQETMLAQTSDGKWEVEVPVISAVPGLRGNVLAGTVVVMPQPIPGIEFIINKADMTNGVEAEEDNELRGRAKHALEFAGKATYVSLESAIRSIEGVRSLLIEDMPENVPGLVKVVVDGGDMDRIMSVIDNTRAAGIKVEVVRPQIVYVNVSLALILHEDVIPAAAAAETEKRIRSYISALEIGDNVLFSRLVELIVSLEGIWDVKGIMVAAQRADGYITESELDNIDITGEERAEPRMINISFEVRK